MDADRRTRRFKVHGKWEGNKPNYHLVEFDPSERGWITIGEQKVNSTLKELKRLLVELYPDYRFYNFTRRDKPYREFFAFPPENPDAKVGWIN